MAVTAAEAVPSIRKLPGAVVGQIAAGEVIERPASALKELLENALDGEASKIAVDIVEGGTRRLAVLDDGCGIPRDDLGLAVSPHATSKIVSLDDLERLATMGFRGEALASMASVADLTVRSRVPADPNGHELALRGEYAGEDPKPRAMAPGTEVIVEDLFGRLPARRKFLRRPPTEWAHCETVFNSFALACESIELSLSREDQMPRRIPAQERRERIIEIYGASFGEQIQHASHDLGPLMAEVYIAPGLSAGTFRNRIILNGRPLKDRMLTMAVRRGCADVARGGDPSYALFLDVPPTLVDVNAHPAKTEVRFREPRAIFKFAMDAVALAVAEPLGPGRRLTIPARRQPQEEAPAAVLTPSEVPRPQVQQGNLDVPVSDRLPAVQDPAQGKLLPPATPMPEAGSHPAVIRRLGRPLGQVHGVYLLAESEEGLVVIDIHAAHERLLYEQLKLASEQQQMQSQTLLEPVPLDLSPEGLDAAEDARKEMAALGFDLRNEDGAEILHAVPAPLADRARSPEELASAMIEQIAETGIPAAADELRDSILSTAACHAAVRGKIPQLSESDMQALLRDMEKTMRSGVCNHGRPCWQLLEVAHLDRMFQRGR